MKPRIPKEFFERYRRAKFPNDVIATNVLKSSGYRPTEFNLRLRLSRRMVVMPESSEKRPRDLL